MKYVGLQAQKRRNNTRSLLLLAGFPLLILGTVFGVLFFLHQSSGYASGQEAVDLAVEDFTRVAPFVAGVVLVWFLIAFTFHSQMIRLATGAKPLERKENKRIYNLVENLAMSQGMRMPKVYIMESDALNAFASGLNEKTYAITVTRGLMEKLNDEELEGVLAHELAHIKNNDVRLLIISIIFVGIISFVVQVAFRSALYGSFSNRRDRKSDGRLMLIILVVSLVAYLLSILFKFALSRKREYMADAHAAEMTRNPLALASALRKISGNHKVDSVKSGDVEQMFIENAPDKSSAFAGLGGLFSTHPPIDKRIKVLEQF